MGKGLSLRKRRTSGSISGENGQEQGREKVSGWYYADLAVAIVALVLTSGSWLPFMFCMLRPFPGIFLAAGILVFASKGHYRKNVRGGRPRRIAAGIGRGIFYAAALTAVGLNYAAISAEPALYPVRKAIYCFNYGDMAESIFCFLPDKIPGNAENYQITMSPRFLQGEAIVGLKFITDKAWLDSYRDRAADCGAVKKNAGSLWQKSVKEATGIEEALELWEFPRQEYGGHRAVCVIGPESGYFMITW